MPNYEGLQLTENLDPKKEKPKNTESPETAEKMDNDSRNIQKEFGLNKEDLEGLGFYNKEISDGQRLLIMSNLQQLTLGRIEEEALQKYNKNLTESKFFGRIWQGISKKYQIAKLEQANAQEIIGGGKEAHGKILKQLIDGAKLGPDAEIIDGRLEVKYMSEMGKSAESQKIINEFNAAATEFSKIPYEWSVDGASKQERDQYNKVKEKYETAKRNILEMKKVETGEKEAMILMNDIDGKVNLNRFLNAHPDVEKQLKKIKDPKAWMHVIKNIATERGLYFAAGFVARTATTSLIGFAGMPLAAAGMGGYMSYKRGKENLSEKDVMARKGEADESKEAKNFVNTPALVEKIDFLMEKIEAETDEGKRNKLVDSLKTRISYTEGKIEKGLVNFGASEERLANQYNLITNINRAKVYVNAENQEKTKLEKRLEDFLDFREEKISDARRNYLIKQTLKGAVLGAGFAAAGVALRHFGEGLGWFSKGSAGSILSPREAQAGDFSDDVKAKMSAYRTDRPSSENFEMTVKKGEGYLHQARKAIAGYMPESGKDLARPQKLWLENKLWQIYQGDNPGAGGKTLHVGDKVNFSKEQIEDAINQMHEKFHIPKEISKIGSVLNTGGGKAPLSGNNLTDAIFEGKKPEPVSGVENIAEQGSGASRLQPAVVAESIPDVEQIAASQDSSQELGRSAEQSADIWKNSEEVPAKDEITSRENSAVNEQVATEATGKPEPEKIEVAKIPESVVDKVIPATITSEILSEKSFYNNFEGQIKGGKISLEDLIKKINPENKELSLKLNSDISEYYNFVTRPTEVPFSVLRRNPILRILVINILEKEAIGAGARRSKAMEVAQTIRQDMLADIIKKIPLEREKLGSVIAGIWKNFWKK